MPAVAVAKRRPKNGSTKASENSSVVQNNSRPRWELASTQEFVDIPKDGADIISVEAKPSAQVVEAKPSAQVNLAASESSTQASSLDHPVDEDRSADVFIHLIDRSASGVESSLRGGSEELFVTTHATEAAEVFLEHAENGDGRCEGENCKQAETSMEYPLPSDSNAACDLIIEASELKSRRRGSAMLFDVAGNDTPGCATAETATRHQTFTFDPFNEAKDVAEEARINDELLVLKEELAITKTEKTMLQSLCQDVQLRIRELDAGLATYESKDGAVQSSQTLRTRQSLNEIEALLDAPVVSKAVDAQRQFAPEQMANSTGLAPNHCIDACAKDESCLKKAQSQDAVILELVDISADLLAHVRGTHDLQERFERIQQVCRRVCSGISVVSANLEDVSAALCSNKPVDKEVITTMKAALRDIQSLLRQGELGKRIECNASYGDTGVEQQQESSSACSLADSRPSPDIYRSVQSATRSFLTADSSSPPASYRHEARCASRSVASPTCSRRQVYAQSMFRLGPSRKPVASPERSGHCVQLDLVTEFQTRTGGSPAQSRLASPSPSLRLGMVTGGQHTWGPPRSPSPRPRSPSCPTSLEMMLPRLPEQTATIEHRVAIPNVLMLSDGSVEHQSCRRQVRSCSPELRVRQHFRPRWTLDREERFILQSPAMT